MLSNKKIFISLLLFFFSLTTSAQIDNIDSLEFIIKFNADNNEKVNAYVALSKALLFKDFESSIENSNAGSLLAKKLNNPAALSDLQKNKGMAWYFKGVYDSAAFYYFQALEVLKIHPNVTQKAGVLNELGKLYRKTRDLDRALQMYDEAYALYKSINDENGMATILNESGVVFEYKKDYEEAIKRYQSSLAIRELMNDAVGKAYSLNFIGGVYTLQKKFPEAENYLLQSLELRKKLKDSFAIALNYGDLGFLYKEQGLLAKAIDQYSLSNNYANKIRFSDLLLSNYKELSDIAEKKGDFASSLDYYKKQAVLKDSIYTGDKMKQIEELNAKYQSEKKEQQLKLQESEITKKNYLLWGLFTGISMLLLAALAFYRKRQIQNKMEVQSIVIKQQDLATRAILNAEENERKRIAAELHDGVGQVMSAAKMNLSALQSELYFKNDTQKNYFNNVIDMVDESCREVRSVSHQMMPNALLKGKLSNAVKEFLDKIDSRIIKITLHTEGLNERIDSNTETILYRVIQECVNNVIKHSGANKLDISLIKDIDGISATIEDNGKGFDVNTIETKEGIGLTNIRSRIKFLKGSVDFDSSTEKGTLVAIHVPITE